MKTKKTRRMPSAMAVLALVVLAFGLGWAATSAGWLGAGDADAQDASPTAALADRDVYYPGSEDLASDEMRIIACGTGMPNARPKQAAACWIVELGNGDKFIFDIGLGSAERIAAMKIPYDFLDKVFIGHLHADHIGDLDALWIGGVISNRQVPLRIWGPSGATPETGTAYMIEHLKKAYAWDMASRQGNVNTLGLTIEVNEFDYKAVNEVVYQENGVTITTIPAIHAYPNKWWMEYTKDSDLAIHECFANPSIMVNKQGFAVGDALNVATQVHTSPAMFGKVMSQIKPRPIDVRRAVRAGSGLHGVQRDEGRHQGPHGGRRRGHLAVTLGLSAEVRGSVAKSRVLGLHQGRTRRIRGRDQAVLRRDEQGVRYELRGADVLGSRALPVSAPGGYVPAGC